MTELKVPYAIIKVRNKGKQSPLEINIRTVKNL